MFEERHYIEELRSIANHYPLWPGDTLSHQTAKVCSDRGWIVRNADGNWIPTAAGLAALDAAAEEPQ